jgi:hypothetical protein
MNGLVNKIIIVECEKNEDCSVIKDATCNIPEKLCECAGNSVLDASMQNCLPGNFLIDAKNVT